VGSEKALAVLNLTLVDPCPDLIEKTPLSFARRSVLKEKTIETTYDIKSGSVISYDPSKEDIVNKIP
jgi:hypothetical protein